jgi:hypothetical protein
MLDNRPVRNHQMTGKVTIQQPAKLIQLLTQSPCPISKLHREGLSVQPSCHSLNIEKLHL